MDDKEIKKLNKIEKELNKASKMHKSQADRIGKMTKESLQELEGLFEKLCAKGKAYRAKRMRAGEKSSAYLSGRAVKVCKGQMKGEGEEIEENVYYVDAVNENEEYCPVCAEAMLETVKEALNKIGEGRKKGKCKT